MTTIYNLFQWVFTLSEITYSLCTGESFEHL